MLLLLLRIKSSGWLLCISLSSAGVFNLAKPLSMTSLRSDRPTKVSNLRLSSCKSCKPKNDLVSSANRCQILLVLAGLALSSLIALPRIWLVSIKEPTLLASTKEFTTGASQPSPNKARVPMSNWMSPAQSNWVTSWLWAFSGPVILTYAGAASKALKLSLYWLSVSLCCCNKAAGSKLRRPVSKAIPTVGAALCCIASNTGQAPSAGCPVSIPELIASSRI